MLSKLALLTFVLFRVVTANFAQTWMPEENLKSENRDPEFEDKCRMTTRGLVGTD
jgi:hypothetical protein